MGLIRKPGGFEPDRAALKLDNAPVGLVQEVADVRRDDLDDTLLARGGGGQRRGLPHGALSPFDIASLQLGEPTNIGHRIVDRLRGGGVRRRAAVLAAVLISVRTATTAERLASAAELHWGRGTEMRAGGHGGKLTGVKDIGAGARRPRAARMNIGDDRNGRGEHVSNDVTHGAVEPARRVHLQHDDRRVAPNRRSEALAQIQGRGRANRPVDVKDDGLARGSSRLSGNACRKRCTSQPN